MTETGDGTTPGRSFASSTGIVFFSRIVANIGYLVAVVVIARILGQDGRGGMAFVTVSALVGAVLAELGVPAAVTVLARVDVPRRARLLCGTLLFGVAVGLVVGGLIFGVMAVADLGPASVREEVLLACIPAPACIVIFDISLALLIAAGRTLAYGVIVAAAPWLYGGSLLVVATASTLTVERAIVVWILSALVAGLIATGVALATTGFGRPRIALVRSTVSFGFRAWIGNLAGSINFRFDQILMGLLTTDAILGVYALAVNVSEVVLYLPAAIATLIVPLVAGTPADERHTEVTRLFRLSLLLTGSSVVIAAILGPLAIPVVFGEQFHASIVPFLLLLPGAVGFTAMQTFTSALVGSSRPGASSIGPVIAVAVGIVGDLALIPSYGAEGAAIAASTAMIAGGLAALIAFRLRTPFSVRSVVPGQRDLSEMTALAARALRR